jgi:hypothetical protein
MDFVTTFFVCLATFIGSVFVRVEIFLRPLCVCFRIFRPLCALRSSNASIYTHTFWSDSKIVCVETIVLGLQLGLVLRTFLNLPQIQPINGLLSQFVRTGLTEYGDGFRINFFDST